LAGLLGWFMAGTASADTFSSDPEDPQNTLSAILGRQPDEDALFPVSPLHGLHEFTDRANQFLDEKIGLELGAAYTQAFQGLSKARPDEDRWGTASDADFLGTWKLIAKGKPTQGQIFFHLEARWDWGTTSPEDLGLLSLGSLLGTANTFGPYEDPAVVLRNLYWQQGSTASKWAYRLGKITTDATLATSAHISAIITFLTVAGTGSFAIALPDSGLGAVGVWHFNDRVKLLGIASDANGDRSNFGDIGAGDFFEAIELGVKIAPRTEKAGFSKLTLWHTDGTEDGQPSNGQAGPAGWGFFLKLEQELTADGRAIGIVRYGKSFNDSAFFEQQAGAHFLFYDPRRVGQIRNDVVGLAFNWAKATQPGARSEYNVEVFYRFPLFPLVDTTLSYQSVIHPALERRIDHASVFSLRLRTTF
jgi:hypothetical protein